MKVTIEITTTHTFVTETANEDQAEQIRDLLLNQELHIQARGTLLPEGVRHRGTKVDGAITHVTIR